jgi:hypothetical protein
MKAVSKGHGLKQYIRDKDTQGQTFAHGEMSDTFCLWKFLGCTHSSFW